MRTAMVAGAMVLAMAGTAAATPTVSLVGTYDDHTWSVYLLQDSQGDNDGVASIMVKVGNVLTAMNVSPSSTSYVGDGSSNTAGIYGFNQLHAAVEGSPGVFEIMCGINPQTFPTQYALRHMGQQVVNYTITNNDGSTTAMSVPTSPGATLTVPTNTAGITPGNYPYSFKVAEGTLTGGAIPVVVPYSTGVTAGCNVFQLGLNSTMSASASAVFIPEPATLSLLALGGAALLSRRRRRV